MIPVAAFVLAAGCIPIEAPKDQITAGDLSLSLPEWAGVAPDSSVGLAPVPGVTRVFRIVELRRLAERFGIASSPDRDICFQRRTAEVTAQRMLPVMRAQLAAGRIEILETSRLPAPEGDLEFPLAGLRPGYWFGYVTYGANHKFVVWARVDVKATVQCLVASADLIFGQPIDPANLRIETREEFPSRQTCDAGDARIDDVAGRLPRRTIRAGTVVQKQWLEAPKLVLHGEIVKVDVISGSTRLEAEGVAETSGSLGEMISVRNPESKRRFRARVVSKGRVRVEEI